MNPSTIQASPDLLAHHQPPSFLTTAGLHITFATSTIMASSGDSSGANLDGLFASLRSSSDRPSPQQSARGPAQGPSPFGFDGSITSRNPHQSGITRSTNLLVYHLLTQTSQSLLPEPSILPRPHNRTFSTCSNLGLLPLHHRQIQPRKPLLRHGQIMEAQTLIVFMDVAYPPRIWSRH